MPKWIFMIEVDGLLVSRHRVWPKIRHDVHKHVVRVLKYDSKKWEERK